MIYDKKFLPDISKIPWNVKLHSNCQCSYVELQYKPAVLFYFRHFLTTDCLTSAPSMLLNFPFYIIMSEFISELEQKCVNNSCNSLVASTEVAFIRNLPEWNFIFEFALDVCPTWDWRLTEYVCNSTYHCDLLRFPYIVRSHRW